MMTIRMILPVVSRGLVIFMIVARSSCRHILTNAHEDENANHHHHHHQNHHRAEHRLLFSSEYDNTNNLDSGNDIAPILPRRKLITRYEDIATELRKEVQSDSTSDGGINHFDIEAKMTPEHDMQDDAGEQTNNIILLHLTKMSPAVSTETEFLFHPGRHFDNDMVNDLAVLASSSDAHGQEEHVNDDKGGFTILSVNLKSGDTKGIQRERGGQIRQFIAPNQHQPNSLHVRTLTQKVVDRKFACGVDHAHSIPHGHHVLNSSSSDSSMKSIFLRSASSPKAMTTSTASDTSTFVINVVIAIDTEFIILQGGTGPAVEYINWLISATNAILDTEVGAQLKVVKIEETNIFNNAKTLDDGLNAMKKNFAGTIGGNKHLVHALLGRHIGGGIAYVDTVCNSDWGYGLSSGIQGSISNLDGDAFQDAFMVAHEIGHSLGSGHTFDGYDPPVDTCGVTCPSRLPLDNSATVMSYCNFCNGGLDNIAMTFGGKWTGEGSKLDISSWKVNAQLVSSSVSKGAQRVSYRIWKSLATTGQCNISVPKITAPTALAPSPVLTFQPTKSTTPPSNSPTSLKPTESPSPPPSLEPTIVPSVVPTPSKRPTKSPTFFLETPKDGRVWYQPNSHCKETLDCATSPGVIFDMVLLDKPFSNGVAVKSFQFEHIRNNATVDVYTMDGSSRDGDQDAIPWIKIGTVDVNPSSSFTKIDFNSSLSITPGGRRGFYIVNRNRNNFFLVGPTNSSALPSYDVNGVAIQDGSVRFGTFGVIISGYTPAVQAGYEILPPPKAGTNLTSMPQTTVAPKLLDTSYALGPDRLCKDDCFVAPGFMFNVRLTNAATHNTRITSISFGHLAPKQQRSVNIYRSIQSSYSGNEQNPSKWIKIATIFVPQIDFYITKYTLDQPINLSRGEIVAFYLQTEENILLVRQKDDDENPTLNNVQLMYGSSIMNGSFGIPVSGYSWNGAVTFTVSSGAFPSSNNNFEKP